MGYKYHWLYFFIPYIFLSSAQHPNIYIPNFCYDDRNKGSRLNTTLFTTTNVDGQLDCLIVCDQEPCCRSINFKKISSSPFEKNCEMLHNVVYNTSEKLLETDPSFDHLYFISSEKEYNASCLKPRGADECSGGNHSCHVNARCVETVVSYHCECLSGYHGDGYNCTDQFNESTILANEPVDFKEKLNEWLPETGQWRICWRGSKHGWEASKFHNQCNEKIPTLVIIKVWKDDINFIFGGYSTEIWAGEVSSISAPGSFMFSLRNNDNLEPFKAPLRDQNDKNAIRREKGNGPIFGAGHDLNIAHDAGSNSLSLANFGASYQSPTGYTYGQPNAQFLLAGSFKFRLSEIEVFYLN